MEKKKFVIFFLITGFCLLMANELLTNSTGAPARYTGAPNEGTCASCHTTNAVNVGDGGLAIQVLDVSGVPVAEYHSGQTYTIKIVLNAHSGQQTNLVGGFEVTAIGTGGASQGTWAINTNSMKLVQGMVNGNMRRYVTHNSAQAFKKDDGIEWEIQWDAPANNIGHVTFYAAGNSANNNLNALGDYIYTASLSLPPAMHASVAGPLNYTTTFKVLQNPVNSSINLHVSTNRPQVVNFYLTNLKGQNITLSNANALMAGKNSLSFSTQGISPGIYLLNMAGDNVKLCQKIMVQG